MAKKLLFLFLLLAPCFAFGQSKVSVGDIVQTPWVIDTSRGAPTVHIHTAKDGGFYFVVLARNGQVRTTSETYVLISGCRKAARDHIAEMRHRRIKIVDHTK